MNAEDNRRLLALWQQLGYNAKALENGGGILTLVIRIGRDGHVCRRESSLRVESFPLDQRAEVGGS